MNIFSKLLLVSVAFAIVWPALSSAASRPQDRSHKVGSSQSTQHRRTETINSRKSSGVVVSESGINPGLKIVPEGAVRVADDSLITVTMSVKNVSAQVFPSIFVSLDEGQSPCYLPGLEGSDIRPKIFKMALRGEENASEPKRIDDGARRFKPGSGAVAEARKSSQSKKSVRRVRNFAPGQTIDIVLVFDRLPSSLQRMKRVRIPLHFGNQEPLLIDIHNLPIRSSK